MNKSITVWLTTVVLAVLIGYAAGMYFAEDRPVSGHEVATTAEEMAEAEAAEPEILYWVAPMDPNYRRDEPGKSPMGMDLVPVYADESQDDEEDAFRISAAVEHNLGVRTGKASLRPLWRRVKATGYVGFDEKLLSRIHMRTDGWVERLLVDSVGERVRKGQLLFEYYSPQLVNAQKEYLQSWRRGEKPILDAAREKLLALGMIPEEIEQLGERGTASRTIRVLAPRDGVITELNAREGMYLKPESEVVSLADLSSVWMLAEVFEAQADWVAVGQAAEARLDYLPGEVFSGTVDYVYPVLDPQTRTLRVRLQFDNPGERLKPNMYAEVTIFGKSHLDALTIHRDALIRGEDSDRVIVSLGDGRFQAREVMTGIESGDWIQVIAGLEEGETVVTSAQFMLDSEASMTASFRRLEPMDDDAARKPARVFGSGKVEELNRSERWLMIRHGPIDALGWPAMTMKFAATQAVELERIQEGQNVHFAIRPDDHGTYVVEMVHLVDAPEDKVGAAPEGHHD